MKAKDLVRKAGIRPDSSRDQHFLVDDDLLDRIVGYADSVSNPDDHCLEIGGGAGVLTSRLAERYEKVTAVELDPDLADFLRHEFNSVEAEVEVIEGDVLEVDLPEFDVCVSNLPYSASSPILFRLLPLGKPLVVTVQREFAERVVAQAGEDDYSRLSVTARHYAQPVIEETVAPSSFDPQPEVESAVLRLEPRDPDYDLEVDDDVFLDFLRGVFTQRRKTLRNCIRNTTHITGIEDPEEAVSCLSDDTLRKRPGKITPEEYAEIVNTVYS